MSENRVVIGAFAEHTQAEVAMQALRDVGFRDEYIGFIVREEDGVSKTSDTMPLISSELHANAKNVETQGNVAAGMMTGGIVGGMLGAAAASLLIPGIGLAFTGGMVASTLSGMALGAITGGIIGPLIHLGVSEEDAHYYDREFQSGRTIVIVQADDQPLAAFQILERYQAMMPGVPSSVSEDDSMGIDDPEATIKLERLE